MAASSLFGERYGWDEVREALTARQWVVLVDVLRRAGERVPWVQLGPPAAPADVPGTVLGEFTEWTLLTLPGCPFVVRQYIGPRLRRGTTGVVVDILFRDSRWWLTLRADGEPGPLDLVPLGLFTGCCAPFDGELPRAATRAPRPTAARPVAGSSAHPSVDAMSNRGGGSVVILLQRGLYAQSIHYAYFRDTRQEAQKGSAAMPPKAL